MERRPIMVSNAYQLGLYEKSMPSNLTWEEKFNYCKEFGFDWLEISIDESDEKLARLDWTSEKIQEIKRLMVKSDVPILTLCLSGHRKYPLGSLNLETEKRSIEIMEKAIHLASSLGVRIIQLAGYDVYYDQSNNQTTQKFKENLIKGVQYASKYGVTLAFETMETPFMDTVEKAQSIIQSVGSPYLQLYPDVGNLTNASKIYHHDVLEDLYLGQGHVVAAHLKETKVNHYREVPFGMGHTDFIPLIKMLKNMGVAMFVGEFWYIGQDDWKKDCKEAAQFLRNRLDQVFEESH